MSLKTFLRVTLNELPGYTDELAVGEADTQRVELEHPQLDCIHLESQEIRGRLECHQRLEVQEW